MDDQFSDPNARDEPEWTPSERAYLPEYLRQQLLTGITQGRAAFDWRQAILDEHNATRDAERATR